MDWYHPQIGLISTHRAFTLNGFQYPAGWLAAATNEERAALGFLPVRIEARPDERFYSVVENSPEVANGIAVVSYQATPKDLEMLKAQFIRQIKQTAGTLLAPTDWKVIRAAEGVKPLDTSTATYRVAVRAASDQAEVAVLQCVSVEELAGLPEVNWPQI